MRLILAVAALALGACPLAGRWSPAVDAFSSFLPLAVPVALAAILPWPGRVPRHVLATSGLALLAAVLGMAHEFRFAGTDERGKADLVLVTHNVAFANRAPEATVAALVESKADILLLQETDGTFAPYLSRIAETYPYRNRCANRCSLAIFSRLPMARVRYKFRTSKGQAVGPPLQQSEVHLSNGTTFPLATIHLPWPLPAGPQNRMLDSLADTLAKIDHKRLILAGDFNLTPWAAAMRYLDDALKPMRRATRAAWSFPAYVGRMPALPVLPIDHVFVGPDWEILRVERLARTGSDHYPLRIALRARSTPSEAGAKAGRSTAEGNSE